jgi:hypothetical protein
MRPCDRVSAESTVSTVQVHVQYIEHTHTRTRAHLAGHAARDRVDREADLHALVR